MAAMLYGLYLTPFFNAVAQVESDRGATSKNVYQIRHIYVDDLNRIYPYHYLYSSVYDKYSSEKMMYDYLRHYAYLWARKNKGKKITYEVLARIHNGGPDGMLKGATISYWVRVRRVLIKELGRDVGQYKTSGLIDSSGLFKVK